MIEADSPEPVASRPCRYCVASWSGATSRHGDSAIRPTVRDCVDTHRDDPRVYDLARALSEVLQDRRPSDEQVAWFLADADEVVDDFVPPPDRWRVRRLPESANDRFDGIEVRVRINDVTYVVLEGSKDCRGSVLRLSSFRAQLRAAG